MGGTGGESPAEAGAGPPPGPGGRPGGRAGAAAGGILATLRPLAEDPAREHVTLADILEALQGRAGGALFLVLALPNALPVPPGTSGILGLPLILLSAQMALGLPPWLPRRLAGRALPRERFAALLDRMAGPLGRAAAVLRPRPPRFDGPRARRLLGLALLAMSVLLSLPLPLGNVLPALGISAVALGLIERDGLWVLAGLLLGLLALGQAALLLLAVLEIGRELAP